MFLYKDNRFHFYNISFCLPDNVYLNTDCEEYNDCIELQPNGEDFRIIIFGDYSDGGAKQFFTKGEEEECYRWVGELTPFTVGNLSGFSLAYRSAYNGYAEYRFDINGENDNVNVLGILVHRKIPMDIDEAVKHPAVVCLLQSLKTE